MSTPEKYGAQGGKARAARLTKAELQAIGRAGAAARWAKEGKVVKNVPVALYGAPERPMRIGEVEIPAYVLSDGRRVLAQRGLQSGIGLSTGGSTSGARRLAVLMDSLEGKGIDTKGLAVRINNPIRFALPKGGVADGYEAAILPDICAVVIDAHQRGGLMKQQQHIAERCAALQHGFATVGIIALVDEATGYQDFRARDALAKILEKFIDKELRPWVRTFPPEFYQQIFRLRDWGMYTDGKGTPRVVAYWTNDIVYRRIAPKVLEELQARTPRTDAGRLKNRLFQWLTDDHGHPKLREHLAGVVMLMKYSPNWDEFMVRLDREYPRFGDTLQLPFPDEPTTTTSLALAASTSETSL